MEDLLKVEHYYQRKGLWLVHILKRDGCFEIYYETTGYSMKFGFGIMCEYSDLEYAFVLAWANLDNYKGMFEYCLDGIWQSSGTINFVCSIFR